MDRSVISAREALKKKAGKYGRLSMPYVIAINTADAMLTHNDFERTLFGTGPVSASRE